MKIRVLVATTLVGVTVALSASAQDQQPYLKDRRYSEGIGIRAGDLELHPGVEGQVGYDSNYFQRSGDVTATDDEPVIGAYRFMLTPSFSLSTLGPQRLAPDQGNAAPQSLTFNAQAYASLNALVATDSKFSKEVSDQDNVDAGANLALDILPKAPFGADLYGDFVRLVQPSNTPDTRAAYNRDSFKGGAGVTWRPGGGLFEWRLGYELQYNYFEKAIFQEYNNTQNQVNTRGSWRFLPRTAFLYDASLGFINYTHQPTTQDGSEPVRARVGLNGLITDHFGFLGMIGWGATFEDTTNHQPQNFDSLIAQAELKWYILPKPSLDPTEATVGLSSVAIGYARDFNNSYFGDYYQADRGYLTFSYFVGGRVLLSLTGGVSHITYPAAYYLNGTQEFGGFGENRGDATLFSEYRFSDIVGVNLTLRYSSDLDHNRVPLNPAATQVDDLYFQRFEAYLGVRAFW
jgi:hypothetical protein